MAKQRIPRTHAGQNRHGSIGRLHDRHDNAEENPILGTAVHTGRVEHFIGNICQELTEKEDRTHADQERNHDTRIAVAQTHGIHLGIHGQHQDLKRNHASPRGSSGRPDHGRPLPVCDEASGKVRNIIVNVSAKKTAATEKPAAEKILPAARCRAAGDGAAFPGSEEGMLPIRVLRPFRSRKTPLQTLNFVCF